MRTARITNTNKKREAKVNKAVKNPEFEASVTRASGKFASHKGSETPVEFSLPDAPVETNHPLESFVPQNPEQEKRYDMLRRVNEGLILFERGSGEWCIVGRADLIRDGACLQVTKKDGSTTKVIAGERGPVYETLGVKYVVASFRNAPVDRTDSPANSTESRKPRPRQGTTAQSGIQKGTCDECGRYATMFDATDMSGVPGVVCRQCLRGSLSFG